MRNSPASGARWRRSSPRAVDIERDVLRQLCGARLTRPAWAKIARELREYAWQDIEHEVIYAAIERLGYRDGATLREQLPAQATRMGFPDIDWRRYFSSEGKRSPAPSARGLMRQIERMMALRPASTLVPGVRTGRRDSSRPR